MTDATHNTQQAEPLAQAGIAPPKAESGEVQLIPAPLANGYSSETAVQALEA